MSGTNLRWEHVYERNNVQWNYLGSWLKVGFKYYSKLSKSGSQTFVEVKYLLVN